MSAFVVRPRRAMVLAYLMLSDASVVRDDGDDFDAWERTFDALDKCWFEQLTEFERLLLNYERRVAIYDVFEDAN